MTEAVCKHSSYGLEHNCVMVNMTELAAWQLIIKISMKCKDCGKSFTFRANNGFSTNEPTLSDDDESLVIPVDFPSMEIDGTDEDSPFSMTAPIWVH